MKWLTDIIANVKGILLAPVTNVLCVAGVGLVAISFLDYDKTNGLTLHGQLHATPAFAGIILILVGSLLFYLSNRSRTKHFLLDYSKGVQIQRGDLKIRIQAGEIQSLEAATKSAAIVLPANTTFVDDCITDKRSAMGAFFLERFPEKMAALPSLLSQILAEHGLRPDKNGQFAAGTTITLPDEFAKPARIIITASTIRISGSGITSSPHIISACVEAIMKCTADQRIDTIYVPLLGSGHGGVERGIALLFLLLAVLHFTSAYHHIRLVQIVVHPKDIESLNHSKDLRQILDL